MRNPERARGTGTMAPTSTSVDGLETVETRNYTISRAPQARRRCAGRRENGGQLRWTMAPRENPSAEHRSVQRSLRLARASRAHGSWLVRPAEPPDADPHVRSCGRGEWVTTPPMPIVPSRVENHLPGGLLDCEFSSSTGSRAFGVAGSFWQFVLASIG